MKKGYVVTEQKCENKTIVNSKLFELARSTQLLDDYIPNFETLVKTEVFLDTEYPRTPDDLDHTRIFMVYTSSKGNPIFSMIKDSARLNSTFNLDEQLAAYKDAIFDPETIPTNDPVEIINATISASLEYLSLVVLGIEQEAGDNLNIAKSFVPALVSVIYNDPLDVFMNVSEVVNQDTGESHPHLTRVWAVKSRPNEQTTDEV